MPDDRTRGPCFPLWGRDLRATWFSVDPDGQLIGTGRARVTSTCPDDATLIWDEQGAARASGRRMATRNRIRWTRAGDDLHLARERAGRFEVLASFPAALVAGGGCVEAASAYACAPDQYHASVCAGRREVRIAWTILTPRGVERLVTRYLEARA